MASNPNKLSQFWQELKRRRVIHVITVYASAAFVIIELINNLAEPLNLPPNLLTIVVIVLAVGFPLAIVFSWLYDLTREGIEKTKPIDEGLEELPRKVPNAWRIATIISFVVIVGLVTINIVVGTRGLRPGDIQSLLILPFQNYTGDDQLDNLISGMHYALINDVGRISNLIIISKTTSDFYKDANMTLSQIAAELGVDAVLEPAVMCLDDNICFKLMMFNPKEERIWMAEFSESKSQIPNLQNKITKQIATEVKIELTPDQDRILAESIVVDPEALDAYYLGLYYLDKVDRGSLQKAAEHFNTAIKIEPDWAPPYAGMAEVEAYRMQMRFIPPSVAIPKIYENLNKALELDPNSSIAHYTKAVIAVWTEWNWEKGEEEFLKSLELNPNNALCRMFYAHLLNILRRPDDAIYQANQALKLDPNRPFILGLHAALMNHVGNPQSAIPYAKKALSIVPDHHFSLRALSQSYRVIGDYDKWFEEWLKLAMYDDEVIATIQKVFQQRGYLATVEALIKLDEENAKETQIIMPGMVWRYLALKNCDKAMDLLEKEFELHFPSMPYISTWNYDLNQLKENPRYIELLKKMNLPLPEDYKSFIIN